MEVPLFLAHGGAWTLVAAYSFWVVVVCAVGSVVVALSSERRRRQLAVALGAIPAAAALLAIIFLDPKMPSLDFTVIFAAGAAGLVGLLLGIFRRGRQ